MCWAAVPGESELAWSAGAQPPALEPIDACYAATVTERLRLREKLGYGLGDTASNFFFHTFNIFLLSYYVDVFGLAAAAVGTMFLVTKLVDAFTDVGMGMVADRTRSRWGRFRPYILFTALPFGAIGYAMFAGPDLSADGKLVYAYVTYSAMMVAYTVINIPYSSLMGVMSSSSDERTTLSTYRFVCAFGAQLLISGFVIPLKSYLGAGDEVRGYQLTMAIFAIASSALWLVTFATTRERVEPPAGQATDLKGDLAVLVKNRPWLVMVAAALFTLMNVAARGGATLFFMKYYVEDPDAVVFWIFDRTSTFFLSGTAAMVAGVSATKLFTQRFDKRVLMIALTLLNALGLAAFFFIPPDRFGLLLTLNFAATFIVGPTPALVWAMYADIADYGEYTFGRRTTGLVFSGAMFAQKTGLAIGAGVAGWVLDLYGFVPNAVQSEDAVLGIRLLFSVFPAILTALAAFVIFFYPLRDRDVERIGAELAAQR